jgi:chromosome segregation ATPase
MKMRHDEIKSKVGKSATKIWEAYQEVLSELKKLDGAPMSTTEIAQQSREAHVVKAAKKLNVDDLLGQLGTLVQAIQKIKNDYDEVELALDVKKKELAEVHKIEVEANSLIALAMAKDKLIVDRMEEAARITSDAAAQRDEVLVDLAEKRQQWNLETTRMREEDTYDFGREKQGREDALADVLVARTKVVEEREAELGDTEATISELTDKIETINATMDEKIADAVEKAQKSSQQSANMSKAMTAKEHEATMTVANAKIETLEAQVADLTARMETAQQSVADANAKVSEMAQSALKSGADAQTVAKLSEIAASSGKK